MLVVATVAVMTSCGSSTKFDADKVKALGDKPATELTADDFQVLADQFEAAVKQAQAANLGDMTEEQQAEWLEKNEDLFGTIIAVPLILSNAERVGNNPPESVQKQLLKLEEEMKNMEKK